MQLWAGSKVFVDPNCDLNAEVVGIYSENNITVYGRIQNTFATATMDSLCALTVSRRETCAETAWLGLDDVPPINNYSLVLSSSLSSGFLFVTNNGLVDGNIAQVCGLSVLVRQIWSFIHGHARSFRHTLLLPLLSPSPCPRWSNLFQPAEKAAAPTLVLVKGGLELVVAAGEGMAA
jgi:hypothetical protein